MCTHLGVFWTFHCYTFYIYFEIGLVLVGLMFVSLVFELYTYVVFTLCYWVYWLALTVLCNYLPTSKLETAQRT